MASPSPEEESPDSTGALSAVLQLGPDDPLIHARATASEQTTAVYKLVLTGGPCAGKTTALKRMGDFFRAKGFRVYTVPEAATCMYTNGIRFEDGRTPANRFAFQWGLLDLQITQEDGFERFAYVNGQPSIMLCDRGLMDGSVYMQPEEWACLVKAKGMDEASLRDGRYDGILHLVTAADGAEEHYSLDNNEARSESVEMATNVDARAEAAWLGHPRQMLFDNSTDFEAKMDRVTSAASRLVGLPCRPRKLCKFLLTKPPPPLEKFPVPTEEFQAEKIFLLRRDAATGGNGLLIGSTSVESDGPAACVSSESFLEKRGRNGELRLFVYCIATFSSYDDGAVTEDTRRLSAEEFNNIEQERVDPARPKVLQRRVAFLWERQAFELQTDLKPAYGISVLHRHSEGGELSLPTFLSVDE
ncbi:unnamed protein product [Laminaria digitata]